MHHAVTSPVKLILSGAKAGCYGGGFPFGYLICFYNQGIVGVLTLWGRRGAAKTLVSLYFRRSRSRSATVDSIERKTRVVARAEKREVILSGLTFWILDWT